MLKAKGALGLWMREWRRENRYTAKQFARLCGITSSRISEIESGEARNLTLRTLISISKATKTPFVNVAYIAAKSLEELNEHQDQ